MRKPILKKHYSRWSKWQSGEKVPDHFHPSLAASSLCHYASSSYFLDPETLKMLCGKPQVSFIALSQCHLFHQSFIDGPSHKRTLHPPISRGIFLNHAKHYSLQYYCRLGLIMHIFYPPYWMIRVVPFFIFVCAIMLAHCLAMVDTQ